ncbi:GPW/gp25 family protein [Caloramator australicus]|uniref:GPW/gp25 family protein n=1 Tax=Caloramator australicus RC3 TaxID=857293 RepID=I7KT84_9CLOT|nr:GPW/gp25 family protein [Caloramator australicus]CCJ32898.1 GPW/gp25 family protein [Caloramator australicus RC3]
MNEYEIIPPVNEIDFGATGVAEIIQNIKTLLTTIKGTVPFNRDIGIEDSLLDKTTPVAQTKLTAQIINIIENYEPRCEVVSITFDKNESEGILIPKVKVRINDDHL